MAVRIRVQSNQRGRLIVSIAADDERSRQKVIDQFKWAFSLTKHEMRYDRAWKGWGVVRRSHAHLWAWCQREASPENIVWDAYDTPEFEQAREQSRKAYEQAQQRANGTHQQQYQAPKPPKVGNLQAAYDLFHLKPSAPLWVAEAVYKAATKRYHPDAGGDTLKMAAINAAMDRIRVALPAAQEG